MTGKSFDVLADAARISNLTDDDIRRFLTSEISAKRLHLTMARLNDDILSGDRRRQKLARQALDRLGFV